MNSTRRRITRDPRRQSRTALVDGTPRRDGRRRRARDGFGRGRHGAPTGRDSSERVRHGRGGGSVTGKLWECGQCNRLVNRFVNGCRCPNCGWYCGRSLVTVIRGHEPGRSRSVRTLGRGRDRSVSPPPARGLHGVERRSLEVPAQTVPRVGRRGPNRVGQRTPRLRLRRLLRIPSQYGGAGDAGGRDVDPPDVRRVPGASSTPSRAGSTSRCVSPISIPTSGRATPALDREPALALLEYYRNSDAERARRRHAFLELAWYTGARQGALRGLDVRDLYIRLDDDEQKRVEFRHRPETGTPLKNKIRGERPVGIPDRVARILSEYVGQYRYDSHDDSGRQPLLASSRVGPGRRRSERGAIARRSRASTGPVRTARTRTPATGSTTTRRASARRHGRHTRSERARSRGS